MGKEKKHCSGAMLSIFVVTLVYFAATAVGQCTTASPCATACVPPDAHALCSTVTDGAITKARITLAGQTIAWATSTTAGYSYPDQFAIEFTGTGTVNFAGSTLTFVVPATSSVSQFVTLINVTDTRVNVRMDATVALTLGSLFPSPYRFFSYNAAVTNTNWQGLLQGVSSTTSQSCVTPYSTASYGANFIDIVTETRTITGTDACPGFPGDGGLSGGAIAGIVIGSLIGAALLVILIIFLFRKLDFDSKRQLFSRTKIHAAESSVPMYK